MSPMEKSSLKHATAWLNYAKSRQSALDLEREKEHRRNLDKKLGHSPQCGILRCHPSCPRLSSK